MRQFAFGQRDGNLELFRGPFFPNGRVCEGEFLTADEDELPDVPRGPWPIIKTFDHKEAADHEALVTLIGWDRVRALFKYKRNPLNNRG